jgi:hypothetical protein
MSDLLDSWLKNSPLRGQWISKTPVQVYVRKTPRVINGLRYDHTITLASIGVIDRHQRKGYAAFVMKWIERQLEVPPDHFPVEAIYLENVITPRMMSIVGRHGWIRDDIPSLVPGAIECFYKARPGAGVPPPA